MTWWYQDLVGCFSCCMHPGIDGTWLAKSNKLIIPHNMLSVHLSADCCHCIWRSGHRIPAIQKRRCIPWRACRNCQSQFEPPILQIITFELEPLLGCTLWRGRRGQISLRRSNQIPKIRPVLTRHIIQALRRSAPLSHTWHIDSQIHHPRGLWNLELHLDRRVAMHYSFGHVSERVLELKAIESTLLQQNI
jgi:hypothetical protein